LIGGAGNDIYVFGEAAAAGEIITDSAGTDRLDVTATVSMAAINAGVSLATGGIEQVLITAGATATFAGAQLSGTTTNVNATTAVAATLAVTVAGTTAVDLSNLPFTVSNTQDAFTSGNHIITITGDGANNEITGTSIADTITAGAGNDTIVTGTGADVINFTGVGTNGQDTITDFIVGTDTLGLVAADTAAGTAGGANAVVEDEAAPAANNNGTAYDLTAVLAANTNAVDLVTLDTAVLTNLANANLANATDGTELLKALVALGDGNAASTIRVDNTNDKFYIAVDDGTNGYLYLADSDTNQFVAFGEITLVGTFNSALIDGVVAAQTVMI
jgi:Ca2+-binding RTX toxin-like protein